MPIFAFKAADQRGQTIDGVMEAADARSVVERLQHDAYFPIQVRPQEERAGLGGFTWPSLRPHRIAGRELVAFTQSSPPPRSRALSRCRAVSHRPRRR